MAEMVTETIKDGIITQKMPIELYNTGISIFIVFLLIQLILLSVCVHRTKDQPPPPPPSYRRQPHRRHHPSSEMKKSNNPFDDVNK